MTRVGGRAHTLEVNTAAPEEKGVMIFGRGLSASIVSLLLASLPGAASAGIVIDLALDPTPVVLGSAPEEQFGYSLAAGDFDADGILELAVGAPGHEVPGLGPNTGAVYVFDAQSILSPGGPVEAGAAASLLLEGDGPLSRFGQTLAAGDIDGDAIDDLVVGAPAWGGEDSIAAGRVYVFLGRSAPDTSGAGRAADLVLSGGQAGGRLGSSIALADVDGDDWIDLVASAYRARGPHGRRSGVVHVLPGTAIAGVRGEAPVSDLPGTSLFGEREGDGLRELAFGDLDGDGAVEAVVGAHYADGDGQEAVDVGKVYVVPASRLAGWDAVAISEAATAALVGVAPRGLLGSSIALGDIDSDGIDDLIASAHAARGEGAKLEAWGECFLLFGREGGLGGPSRIVDNGPLSFGARSKWDLFGLPVMAADLNGDRAADIVVAAQFTDSPDGNRRRCGEAYVYWGSLRSVMEAKAGTAELADVTIVGAEEMESIGGALKAAGLSGGRTPDLIIGAPDAPGEVSGESRVGRLYVVPPDRLLARSAR